MSNQNDQATLNHNLKDIERQLKKNANQINWVLILTATSLVMTLVSFMIIASKSL